MNDVVIVISLRIIYLITLYLLLTFRLHIPIIIIILEFIFKPDGKELNLLAL